MLDGLLSIMKELQVKNVVISKQGETSKQYLEFKEIVKQKKINVLVVKKGDKINIEKGIYFDILWPKEELISENILNNNSIVIKLNYISFSMLFTGDVEEITEKQMLEEKKSKRNLKVDILKVAHHRFENIFKPSFFRSGKT